MQNLKNDPEKVLEAVLPEILSDEDFACIKDYCTVSDYSLVDLVKTGMQFVTVAMTGPTTVFTLIERDGGACHEKS